MITYKPFLILIAISLLLIFSDRVFYFKTPRNFTQFVFKPVLLGLHNSGLKLFQVFDFLAKLPKIYQENQEFNLKLSQQASLEIANERLKQENQALRNQLFIQKEVGLELLPSQVLGQINLSSQVFLVIDKGESEGVSNQSVVVLEKNLIGKIEKVEKHTALLSPLFGSQSKLTVKIGVKEAQGVIEGELNSQVKLTQVLQEAQIQVGDLILSQGSEGIYPANLVIGRLKTLEKKDWEVYQRGEVELFWDPRQLKTVFVIL